MKSCPRLLTALSGLLTLGLLAGCSIDSADEFIRNVSVNFTGYYRGRDNGVLVANNSGGPINTLDLRQTGDELEAVDNHGHIWRGRLGEVVEGTSTFELNGQTTAGAEASFSGTLKSSDGGQATTGAVQTALGVMQGTFIEPDRFSTFYGSATIPGALDDGGSSTPPTNSTNTNVVLKMRVQDWPGALAQARERLWFLADRAGFEDLSG